MTVFSDHVRAGICSIHALGLGVFMRTVVLALFGITWFSAAALAIGAATADTPAEPIPLPAVESVPDKPADTNATPTGVELAAYETSPMEVGGAVALESFEDVGDTSMSDEFESRMRELAWTKGDFKIVPYGALWGSAIYNTRRTFPEPYTLYVLPLNEQGEADFVIDTRRTRLGLDVAGPRIAAFGCAPSGGKVEIDFHGAFVVENKPGVLLRHAYGEIKDDDFRLLAGQTWDVISPLNPGVLSYSVLWAQGNIGYRRAQVRLERYLALRGDQQLTVQMSLNQNIVSDFTAEPGVNPESTAWPVIEGRVALTDNSPGPMAGPVTLGVSGHIGEQGFDFTTVGLPPLNLPPADDVRIRTWSFNVDLRVPVSRRFGFQGEYFMGENLSTFLGGIVQGVCPCLREPIRAHGGWVELWYDWSPCWHSHVGYGVDDPVDRDMLFGRSYNHVLFANLSQDVTSHLVIGTEVTLNKTTFRETRPVETVPTSGESVGIEVTGQYLF
jgi:hypothetical protein